MSSVKNRWLRVLFLSWPSVQKKSQTKNFSLLIFYIQIPFKGLCKDQFWNILYRWKSMYLWNLLLCGYIFHFKWVVIKWNRHDYASFTIWSNIISFLLRFSDLFTSLHLNGLIARMQGGIFLRIQFSKLDSCKWIFKYLRSLHFEAFFFSFIISVFLSCCLSFFFFLN